jgi:Surfeit locus protein 6/60S ribosome biogenesis protein Rrp14
MGKKRTPAAGEGGVADGTTTSTANNSPGDLKTLIHEHSLFFDQLVELIPARFFLPYSGDDKPWFPGLSMSEKKKFKAQTRENIIKSRRDRLDPTQPSSTLDLLKKSLAEEKESSDEEPEDDDDDDNNDDDDEEEDEEQEQQDVGESEKAHNKVTLTGELPVTYEELQERLRRRIAELASGRNTRPESRLKQERKKELKNKKKLKGESKKNKDKDKDAASTSNSSKRKREDGNDEIFSKNKKKNKVGEPTDITFGQVRIDGKDNKKRQKKLPKEKELERAKRLEEIKNDPEKGKKVSWKAAVSKAAGEKVHDNPKLLKQSIKREKKRQQKNAKKWKERELTVAKAKAEKQSKRTDNIRERIHQTKMRKIEKREKKLMRPGFEGKKEGYINE